MFVRRYTTICREGWYYIFVLAFVLGGAVLREVNLLILLAGLMVGPLLLSWRLAKATLSDIAVRREFPPSIAAGETFTVELSVVNQRDRIGSWGLAVADRLQRIDPPTKDDQATAEVFVPYVAPQENASAYYRCELTRRGRYAFGPVTVGTRFPFGFMSISIRLPAADEIVVCPRICQVTAAWRQLVESQNTGSHHSRRQRGTSEGDYFGLRNWRPGDSRRWIHWRSTAKRGELAVLEFEQQRNLDVAILVDLWQPEEPTERQRGNVELALTCAATSILNLCRQGGNRLLVAVAGDAIKHWSATSSHVFCKDLLEQLAIVRAGDSSRWSTELSSTISTLGSEPRVIVFSTRPVEKKLLRALQTMLDRQRGGRGAPVWIDVGSDEIARYFSV